MTAQRTLPLASGRIRAANLRRSPRLQRTLAALVRAGQGGATTLELHQATGSMAVHTDAAELKANGCRIRQWYDGKTASGARVSRYALEHAPGWALALAEEAG